MTLADDRFKRRLARRLVTAASRRVRPKVASASGTLARSISVSVTRVPGRAGDVQGIVEIPHYWAVYVHDGRRPFVKYSPFPYMVWWKNPRRDPRFQSAQTPRRRAQIGRLTPEQWRAALREYNDWKKRGGDPFDSPVVIVWKRRIRKRTNPIPFFSNEPGGGMFRFIVDAGRIAQAEFSQHVRNVLGDSLNFSDEASVVLRG